MPPPYAPGPGGPCPYGTGPPAPPATPGNGAVPPGPYGAPGYGLYGPAQPGPYAGVGAARRRSTRISATSPTATPIAMIPNPARRSGIEGPLLVCAEEGAMGGGAAVA